MNPRRWLQEHSLKLLAIRDTPRAIAGGVAIGIFMGFTPLFGFKTALAIFVAWVTRTNVIAAVLASTLHDLLLPFMPVIFLWEYKIGYLLLYNQWPERLTKMHPHWIEFRNWGWFQRVILPTLVGSVYCGLPPAVTAFFVTRGIMVRHHKKQQLTAPTSTDPLAKD